MRKIAILVLALSVLQATLGYTADSSIVNMRKKFLQESNSIKPLLSGSRDVVLLSTMWDSCFIAMTQLDAYVSMISIIDAVKKENLQESMVDILANWLVEIKNTNNANIRSLGSVGRDIDSASGLIVKRMKIHFSDSNKILDAEIARLMKLKEGIRKKVVR